MLLRERMGQRFFRRTVHFRISQKHDLNTFKSSRGSAINILTVLDGPSCETS